MNSVILQNLKPGDKIVITDDIGSLPWLRKHEIYKIKAGSFISNRLMSISVEISSNRFGLPAQNLTFVYPDTDKIEELNYFMNSNPGCYTIQGNRLCPSPIGPQIPSGPNLTPANISQAVQHIQATVQASMNKYIVWDSDKASMNKPVSLDSDLRTQRKRDGVCPDCGDRGEWIAMAAVCKIHGKFLG